MNNIKYIVHNRIEYYKQTTIGKLFIDGDMFCYTLEDTVRPYGIKVKKHTALPANSNTGYKVGIHHSPSFKRDMLIIHTEDDGITLNYGGVLFTHTYAHGGNDHTNTEGCPLVAYNRYGNKIQGTAESDLFNLVKGWIDEGYEVRWVINNVTQSS